MYVIYVFQHTLKPPKHTQMHSLANASNSMQFSTDDIENAHRPQEKATQTHRHANSENILQYVISTITKREPTNIKTYTKQCKNPSKGHIFIANGHTTITTTLI